MANSVVWRTAKPEGDGIVFASLAGLLRLQAQVGRLGRLPQSSRARAAGGRRSLYKGRGMDFAESRPYQPGDDIRTLDWRVTARTGRPHTKVFAEEREKPVLLWVDLRAPMFFATRGRFKSVVAVHTAALLVWRALRKGDRVGGIVQHHGRHEFKPARSRAAALHLLRRLSDLSLSAGERQGTAQDNGVQASWTRLRRVVQPGSQVVVVSDFRQVTPAAWQQLAMLSRHAQLVLVAISDPFEVQLPNRGRLRLSDGLRSLWVDVGRRVWRGRYQQRAGQLAQQLQEFGRTYRVPLVQLSTAEPALVHWLQLARGLR